MRVLRYCSALLVCVAFFNAGALGAHLRLCLDGGPSQASMHRYDVRECAETARASQGHDDFELKVDQKARTAAVFKLHPRPATATHSWPVPLASPDQIRVIADFEDPGSLPNPRDLLPPLRGPPV